MVTRYFLKTPWQVKRQEVSRNQFLKAKSNVRTRGILGLLKDADDSCGFISPEGIQGWVQRDMGQIQIHEINQKIGEKK